jgi:single-stranded-DNA-specific exonuclease
MPLQNENRTLVKFGLEILRKTKRVGLIELFKEAGIKPEQIKTYEIGHIISPRLNAMGRLEHAMDSLRLVCTKNQDRAKELARKLGTTNRERQLLTQELFLHAKSAVSKISIRKKLIFLYHETYQPGVVGLIAGRLVEEFYRPAIVIHKGEIQSKASARSVSGFNIVEFIREAQDLLVDVGGHPMAAGFTVETLNLELLQKQLEKLASKMIKPGSLKRVLKVDLEIPISAVTQDLYRKIQELSPFGMGNPEPTFLSRELTIGNVQVVGIEGKHLRLLLFSESSDTRHEAIAFGWGERGANLKIGDKLDAVYTIEEREWNGNKALRVKIKDIKA